MARLIIIASVGKNGELGKDNNLIWRFKEDMRFFKENTIGHKIVMGYNTLTSLPGLLPKRSHIVLTHKDLKIEGIIVFNDYLKLIDYLKTLDEDVYIIGGASIYRLFINLADEIVLTEIEKEDKEADVYFPPFNKSLYDKDIIKENEEEDIKYEFVRYRRKKDER